MNAHIEDDDPRMIILAQEVEDLLDAAPETSSVTLAAIEWKTASWMIKHAMDSVADDIRYVGLTRALRDLQIQLLANLLGVVLENHDDDITVTSFDLNLLYGIFTTAVNLLTTQEVHESGDRDTMANVAHRLVRKLAPQLPEGIAALTYERFGAMEKF